MKEIYEKLHEVFTTIGLDKVKELQGNEWYRDDYGYRWYSNIRSSDYKDLLLGDRILTLDDINNEYNKSFSDRDFINLINGDLMSDGEDMDNYDLEWLFNYMYYVLDIKTKDEYEKIISTDHTFTEDISLFYPSFNIDRITIEYLKDKYEKVVNFR